MNGKNKILAMVPAMVLGIGLAIPAFAQDASVNSGVPASTSMHRAGEDTEGTAKNAYDGTVTAVDDTRITTEVKTDLATASDLRSGQIHVTTTAGVVTLDGVVNNPAVVARAEAIARDASGVRGVTNDLRVSSSVPLN
jgi:hyperosmotically inducible periplasmic protein